MQQVSASEFLIASHHAYLLSVTNKTILNNAGSKYISDAAFPIATYVFFVTIYNIMNNTGSKYNHDAACLIASYHVFLSIVINYGNAVCKDISDVCLLTIMNNGLFNTITNDAGSK